MSPLAQAPSLATPWDAIAGAYDAVFTESAVGRIQREQVMRLAARVFRAGDRVIELNCGTGVDAARFGDRGILVDAFDQSPAMARVAFERVAARGLEQRVKVAVLATEDIGSLGGTYDGAFSNFSGLNCVADLRPVAKELARRLRPGASALLCFSSRVCLWELAWYGARFDWRRATRRLRRGGVDAVIGAGGAVRVQYPGARELRRIFAPEFRLRWIRGIGIATPPSYAEDFARRHATALRAADWFDGVAGRVPLLRTAGDHMLLCFERQDR